MKDYEEIEVWVNESILTDGVGFGRKMLPEQGDNKHFIKATLRIPKPERKVEITESELREYLDRNDLDEDQYKVDYFIEDVFGRGDE